MARVRNTPARRAALDAWRSRALGADSAVVGAESLEEVHAWAAELREAGWSVSNVFRRSLGGFAVLITLGSPEGES